MPWRGDERWVMEMGNERWAEVGRGERCVSADAVCGVVVVGWLRIGDPTGPNDGGKAVLSCWELGGSAGTLPGEGRGRAGVRIRWRAPRYVM